MRALRIICIWTTIICGSVACRTTEADVALPEYSSPIVAQVEDKKLYAEQLYKKGILSQDMSAADSTQAVQSYLQQWIRDQLMLSQAERVVSDNLDINELVADYRQSLILLNYEQQLIAQRLDTVITSEQIQSYYDKHSDSYSLTEPLVRCQLAKVPGKASGIEQFYNQWKAGDAAAYLPYLEDKAELYMLDDQKWYTANEILSLLPDKITIRSLKRKTLQTAADGSEYFVNFLEFVDEKQDPPLSYMSSNIKKILLHDRKVKLLDKIKDDLYQKEINTNKVKVH